MTKARTAMQIIDAIDCDHLSLHRGEGYWYFEYDDCDQLFETRSVMVMYLNSMDLEQWIAEGQALVEQMEGI